MPTGTLWIPTEAGRADAFVAFPDDGERHPGVLMYMDAFGLRPVLMGMARRLAEHGYHVLVPNLFHRGGPAPVVDLPEHIGADVRHRLIERLRPMMAELTPEAALRDADAYLRFLTTRPEVSDGPVGVVGYCMGAVLAVRTAAARPDLVAAVAGFHPAALVTDAPDSPHLRIPSIRGSVHLGIAEGDMTEEALERLAEALDASDTEHTLEVYAGARHGYAMADTDAFDGAAFQRHWERLLPLLDRALPQK